jgi:hypothetical protein
MRPIAWYIAEGLTLAAVAGACWLFVQIADRLQPGAFP